MKPLRNILTHVYCEDREAEKQALSFGLIVRMLRFMKPYARRRNWLLLFVVIRALQLPALAWVIGASLGGPISRHDRFGIVIGAAGYALLALSTQLVLHFRSRLAMELGEDVIRDLRCRMFSHLQSMPMSFFHRTRLGRVISRFTSDCRAMRAGVQNVLFVSMVNIGQMIGAAVLMLLYDGVLFMVVAAMAPLLWLANRYFHKRLSIAYRAVQESFSRVTATISESVSGIRVTQGFVREQTNAGLFHDLVLDHSRYTVDAAKTAGTFIPLLEFKTQFFIAMVLLVGGWRVLNGCASIEDLYQFILMAGVFFSPVQALATQYNTALSAMAGAERVFAFLDTKPDWQDPEDASELPPIQGRVELRNVTFGYNPDIPVLHDVSFVAEPGQTIALVGHTGSGKSSIINMIAKFYHPTSGSVLIDGSDIRLAETDSLRRQMGIVLQENFLFTGTIFENIKLGKPEATREDVVKAAKELDCLDLLAALPDGFNTVVGERGSGISLGQRQLICFTRAMLADPRILIMDEATSSVDTMTEARIQTALNRLLSNRTSFVVAHRLSTIRHANVVLVLDQGRIAERGTHEELLSRGSIYAELYRQFARSTEV
jgi:ATP-binding cassette subfamily B protein